MYRVRDASPERERVARQNVPRYKRENSATKVENDWTRKIVERDHRRKMALAFENMQDDKDLLEQAGKAGIGWGAKWVDHSTQNRQMQPLPNGGERYYKYDPILLEEGQRMRSAQVAAQVGAIAYPRTNSQTPIVRALMHTAPEYPNEEKRMRAQSEAWRRAQAARARKREAREKEDVQID